MSAKAVQNELNGLEDPIQAAFAQRFFKTGKGEYAEGDVFLGLKVPIVRAVASKYRQLSLSELERLLESPIHEHRFAALVIMVIQAKKVDERKLQSLYQLYLKRSDRINNWDLVDVSCKDIVGRFLYDKSRQPLYALARSSDLWERRIAMISTAYFIGKNDLDDVYKIATMLLNDSHDLIHKAVGWMLREAGKRDEARLKDYLQKHAKTMPRTTLRYAVERMNLVDKQYYMQLKFT